MSITVLRRSTTTIVRSDDAQDNSVDAFLAMGSPSRLDQQVRLDSEGYDFPSGDFDSRFHDLGPDEDEAADPRGILHHGQDGSAPLVLETSNTDLHPHEPASDCGNRLYSLESHNVAGDRSWEKDQTRVVSMDDHRPLDLSYENQLRSAATEVTQLGRSDLDGDTRDASYNSAQEEQNAEETSYHSNAQEGQSEVANETSEYDEVQENVTDNISDMQNWINRGYLGALTTTCKTTYEDRKSLADDCRDLLRTIVGFRAQKRKILYDVAEPLRATKRRLEARAAALDIKGEQIVSFEVF